MYKFFIINDNKIDGKKIIVIDNDNFCEIIDDKNIVNKLIKLKSYLSSYVLIIYTKLKNMFYFNI